MFKDLDPELSLPELDKRILARWQQEGIFARLLEEREGEPDFIFYEGPPTANGRPGLHHVMARTVKDAFCRYKSMCGFRVERKAGWDTHGLPVEIEVQKKLGLEGRVDVERFGIEAFNRACRESVFTYKEMWDELTEKMGYWIDLSNPYITLDNNYIETEWWVLKRFFEEGLIYKGHRVVPYCPKCESPLSSHEVSQGYRDIKDPSVTVSVRVPAKDYHLLIWTTTPWTLLSNVAIAVGRDIDYVVIRREDDERRFVLAKSRLGALEGESLVEEEFKGSVLLGHRYEPIFDDLKPDGDAYRVVAGDFVSTEDGTGLVHMAPAFGDDDYRTCQRESLPMLNPIDGRGCFTEAVPWLAGKWFKDADVEVIMRLKEKGVLMRSQKIEHSYPHCWRHDTPLIQMARDAWYIRMTKLKDDLISANGTVNWFPATIGTGRFGKWLENLQDWSLSRDRYWGTPLNIWVCEGCGKLESIGSRKELAERAGLDSAEIELHKPYVDEITFSCTECRGTLKRTPEVIDCWFDSGCMPFAQHHYPFENSQRIDELYPADFICEAIDQTRGWFYSLMAIGVFMKGISPYRNVVVSEMILDSQGQKMSKSKGNVIDPFKVIDTHGADAVRWYLMNTNSVWMPTRADEQGIVAVKRKFFDTLINTYRFFTMYANVDGFGLESERVPVEERPVFDRWMLARMNSVVSETLAAYNDYDLTRVTDILGEFLVEDVSNWYVRLNRRRFWKEGDVRDKYSAY
ncbi:MAG: isoleucine--tRNA ligase, partial [Planctomycetes bacterium]|nr:isoleucine--tRNA ligase [Planctomycetota bacterium]